MKYYAHTAEKPDGTPDPDESKWQPLATHLRNVAELAARFAAPMGPEAAAEAHLAGLLHDLGKYSHRFQSRLHNPSIHGINHWSMGTFAAATTHKSIPAAFSIEGHHTQTS